ncbi:MAG: hypothetical protein N2572_07085 [Syntrophales bacterium]|nr:hypothetical protein [Syntrophales bacterium]
MNGEICCHHLQARLEACDDVAEMVVRRLKVLLPVFFVEDERNASLVLEISFLKNDLKPAFPIEPVLISHSHMSWGGMKTVSNGTAIGFLNGLLSFYWGEGKAKLVLFADREGNNFLTGSAHRLLFVSFALWAAEHNEYLVHGAAFGNKKRGFLFWGSSGAGKSTISAFFPPDEFFSDEAPLLYRKNGSFYCARTPFNQTVTIDSSSLASSRIKRCFFLHKHDKLFITQRDRRTALAEIMKGHIHGFPFMPREVKKKAFDFFLDFSYAVPAFDLYFPPPGDISIVWKKEGANNGLSKKNSNS